MNKNILLISMLLTMCVLMLFVCKNCRSHNSSTTIDISDSTVIIGAESLTIFNNKALQDSLESLFLTLDSISGLIYTINVRKNTNGEWINISATWEIGLSFESSKDSFIFAKPVGAVILKDKTIAVDYIGDSSYIRNFNKVFIHQLDSNTYMNIFNENRMCISDVSSRTYKVINKDSIELVSVHKSHFEIECQKSINRNLKKDTVSQ